MSSEPFKENRGELSFHFPGALYLHVPFCRTKCRYCDFFSRTFDAHLAGEFVRAVLTELSVNTDRLAVPLASAFLGGGTPTVLGTELLGKLLQAVRPLTDRTTELTVEANPGLLDEPLVELLVESGVNRVNLGAQSFVPQELEVLGRTHTPTKTRQAVRALRTGGMRNIGLDLIYGIPDQTLASWGESLSEALGLEIEHLSCYALSFQPGTPLQDDLTAGRLTGIPDDLQRDCYFAAAAAAEHAGLEHYELSNFARPGERCRHNLTYWRNEPYLGIGPGATSYIDGVRRTNRPDLQAYINACSGGSGDCSPPATSERVTGKTAMTETLMLNLRLLEGVDRLAFAKRFGQDPLSAFPDTIGRYQSLAALIVTPSHVRIDRKALFVTDSILADILSEAGSSGTVE